MVALATKGAHVRLQWRRRAAVMETPLRRDDELQDEDDGEGVEGVEVSRLGDGGPRFMQQKY